LVFFGCRHEARDFLYADEWGDPEIEKTLRGDDGGPAAHFVPVFSRDGGGGRYVSHAVRERSERVWHTLRRETCAVVVCGSAGAMPADVWESFVDVCVREGGMDEAQARMFLRRMDAKGAYVVETW
jgi:NADPH-ferrihemoprotein reductase